MALFTGRHVMVDTETLSTAKSGVILQLGACEFFPAERKLGRWWNYYIDLGSSLAAGRSLDPETLLWWLDQDREAQARLWAGVRKGGSLQSVLLEFSDWIVSDNGVRGLGRKVSQPDGVWSHGAAFDLAMLEDTYAAFGLKPGWSYGRDRDTRTLFAMAGDMKVKSKFAEGDRYSWPTDAPPFVKHCGLSDAIAQAITVLLALDKLA